MKRRIARSETVHRSLVKSIVFRVIVISSDFLVIFLLTGELLHSVQIILFTNFASTIVYYLHERLWDLIPLSRLPGKNKHHTKSLIKTVTSRVLIVLSDFFVVNRIIESAASSVVIIMATNIITTILYYLHERGWHKIEWGKIKPK